MVKPEIVQKALKAIKRAADYEYFFDQLTSPDWIEPLWEAGLFRSPYEPIREGEYVRFPRWPESRYLARMAPYAPEIVQKICLKIPDTENIRIHEDLVDAALKMPAHLSAKFVPKAKVWIETPYPSLLPEKLGALIAHFARGGQIAEAFDLARALLAILPDPLVDDKAGGKEMYRLSPQPRPRFALWEYEQILKKHVPNLVAISGEQAFKLLCDLLDSAIRLSRRDEGNEGPADYSYIWRPDIDSQEHHGLKDVLVTAVWNAAIQIIRGDAAQLPRLISILEEDYKWHIFKRIALNLLRSFPETGPGLVVERLLNPALLDAGWCQNEYRQLLKDRFSHLLDSEQERWLDLIEQGPPVRLGQDEKPRSPEEMEQDTIHWRREHLAAIADKLPAEWREQHREWTEGLTVPKDFAASRVVSWVGPTSPKSAQDMKSMSIAELVPFLRNWQPPDDPFAPSPEGLGRQLATVVAEDPLRFAQEAHQFQVLDPTYVRAVIQGLEEACKAKRNFNWTPVLQLCHWIVTQHREITNRQLSGEDVDPDWGWTRKAIGRLLTAGFDDQAHEIPFTLRQKVWEVLEPLTHDPDPTREDEAQDRGSSMDPATRSINTVRGEAMHTVIRYALWIHRHHEKLPNAKDMLTRGFDEIPEVREVLDDHLDALRDPSVAIHAVYGQWFPWLVLLDSRWATSNISKIFPQDANLRLFLDAAWETYVTFCKPYNNVFEILQEEYRRAVDRIGEASEGRHIADPEERLVEHLVIYYLRGKISLDDPDSVLTCFYQKAAYKLRAHVIEFMGRGLYDQKEAFETEILERSKILWAKRLNAVKTGGSSADTTELIPFGWWFASGRLDDTWAIEQLIEVLKIGGWAELDHLVIERLASLTASMPQQVIQCLQMMVEGDKEGWKIIGWRDHIRSILSTAIQGNDPEAREVAIDLVHRLGARGLFEFKNLLPKSS